jgi:hypothetical protein
MPFLNNYGIGILNCRPVVLPDWRVREPFSDGDDPSATSRKRVFSEAPQRLDQS